MPPRRTTDFGALFESLVEDLQMQVAASVERTFADFNRRLSRLERRLDQIDPQNASAEIAAPQRICSLCDERAVARGMCSAHYQQWRYRERRSRLTVHSSTASLPEARVLPAVKTEVSIDN